MSIETPDDGAGPAEPADLLPEHSVLSFEEYMAMQRAVGNETRFRVLYRLKRDGELSAKGLREALDLRGNTLHHHLDTLVDVGLVENRKRKEPDSEGLSSYYRATALGEALLDHGVEELLRREQVFAETYR
ncbi:helix-turn-helix domain-containing protein [Haloarcula litorea]|uniref:helix-turn-helix domain-containing protein n=1 Tax=Haloarcula litorea TaxID=3032579 RepID=UPI0023E8ABB5|nr:helix-turn-helix domain-containing protein [Halomicroarcula sp. GDY20]